MTEMAENSDKKHNISQKRAPTVFNIINNNFYDQFNMCYVQYENIKKVTYFKLKFLNYITN